MKKTRENTVGFTLIEVIFITFIFALMASMLVKSFGPRAQQGRAVRNATAAFMNDIRRAQSLSIASKDFIKNGVSQEICGYGISYVDTNHYLLYQGSNEGKTCSLSNHNFNLGEGDKVYQNRTLILLEPTVQFKHAFTDIFFQPPDPKIYINNDPGLARPPETIQLCSRIDPSVCQTVSVYTSGRIEAQ